MTWPCEAYGPEAMEHGALCFVSGELGTRVCKTEAECHRQVGGERQRVYRRIQELAAAGDPVMADLAEEFDEPGKLLGGEDS